MMQPIIIPECVTASLKQWCEARKVDYDTMRHSLQWDHIMGCYYFSWCGMYHGIELSGYIHT